jgi:hypothetical protein
MAAQLVTMVEGTADLVPSDWSRDGYILFYQSRRGWSVWAVPLAGDGKLFQVLPQEAFPYAARLSPESQWIAYAAFEAGRFEVYVQKFLTPGQKQQISHGGATHPRWSADGRELVYWAVPRGVEAVSFQAPGSTFHIGPRRSLVQPAVLGLIDARTHYDITRDGKRLVVRQPAGQQQAGVAVVVNWTEKLK